MKVFEGLKSGDKRVAVIGLGYVGLPLALVMSRRYNVIGYDHNRGRIDLMKNHTDPSKELNSQDFEDCDIEFTDDEGVLKQASLFIVAVPTPVDDHKVPDLSLVYKAAKSIAKALKKGDFVVFESTVYPGCTEEDCLPILERESGLKEGLDFHIGYSPERINPGDKIHNVKEIPKVVSARNKEALNEIAEIYNHVLTAGVFKATSIKVAEAAKVIENTQRDLNISFINELSIIFDKMQINTQDVLDAASTKWNFLRFSPGLVGGHCIGVDPYYLLHKSKQMGYDPQVILSGRRINDGMPAFVAKKLVQMLIQNGKNPKDCRVLVMGITFKENVSDIRNSKVAELVHELTNYSIEVEAMDPNATSEEVMEEYGFELIDVPGSTYDAVVVAVGHNAFLKLESDYFQKITNDHALMIDIKGIYRHQNFEGFKYWSL